MPGPYPEPLRKGADALGSAEKDTDEVGSLQDLLDRLCGAVGDGSGNGGGSVGGGPGAAPGGDDPDRSGEGGTSDDGAVTLDEILEAVGRRSFGPLLLLAGLVVLAPLVGDIPTVPTIMALLVLLVAVQLLLRRNEFWLPGWLLRRSVERGKIRKAVGWLRRPARWVDRILRPRLKALTGDAGAVGVALACILIALAMPPMEFIPFSANIAGVALAAFGLALVTRDGVVALVAFAFTFGALGWVGWSVLT